jgi:hypothetical protein
MTARSLHSAASEALDVLYQHRLLSTSQLHEIVLPGVGTRWMQQALRELAERGLAASIPAFRPRSEGPGEKVWYLTERGAAVVEAVAVRPELRRRLIPPMVAAGPFQAHTLAVNDVGVAFLRAARQRGHLFGRESWRHEVAHDLRSAPRQPRDFLVTDALLKYWTTDHYGQAGLRYRFLELDRATVLMDDLASRLARYAHLHRRWLDHWSFTGGGQSERLPNWPLNYRVFPAVIVALANPRRANLRRRMETLIALCRSEPDLRRCPEVSIYFALLDDLVGRGPFAPVFQRLEDDRSVNWLGEEDGSPQGEAATA